MHVKAKSLLQFLDESVQFTIPIFQRIYSWDTGHCGQLWKDIMDIGESDGDKVHLVGSVIYILEGRYGQSPLSVIDGQQRLTTVFLILEALARKLSQLSDATNPIDGVSEKTIKDQYLLSKEDKECKLILTQTDKTTLAALIERGPLPTKYSNRVLDNFNFFVRRIEENSKDLNLIWQGLRKLKIVEVGLRESNDPQRIFESMNHTGKELNQADLIRNFVLMGLQPKNQTRLYEKYWRPIEVEFGQKAYDEKFNSFIRHYLTLKTRTLPKVKDVYEVFKAYKRDDNNKVKNMETLVKDVHKFAIHYYDVALDEMPNDVLGSALKDLRELKVDVAYPLLLRLYGDYKKDLLNYDELVESIRLIESYVFRRAACSLSARSHGRIFATFGRNINEDKYLESIKTHFFLLSSTSRFPKDDEFKPKLKKRNLYSFRHRNYWLRRLENYDRNERVMIKDYTIEHIMPQTKNLSREWKTALGPDWESVQQKWLHTLGNLTLTGYNKQYGAKPFLKKRDMVGGFHESPLRLNKGLGQLNGWGEAEIKRRAERLANLAIKVWKTP